MLLEAYDCAMEASRDVWDFAVEISVLEECGITRSGFRSLVCKGLVHHARESKPVRGQVRSFRPTGNLTFHRRTCFILTESGVQLARGLAAEKEPSEGNGKHELKTTHVQPRWDPIRQELTLSGQVVKRFKVPAPNQELVLAVFQEEGWPLRIDDPLPYQPDQDPKRRLHDTINALNRRQINQLLRFVGDGKGSGIRWESRTDARRPDDGRVR